MLVFIFFLCFVFLTTRYPERMTAGVIFALPFYLVRIDWLGMNTNFLEIMIWALMVGWMIWDRQWLFSVIEKVAQGRIGHGQVFFRVCLGIFLMVAAVSIFLSVDKLKAWQIWQNYFLQAVLFMFIFLRTIKTRRDLHLVFGAMGASVFFVSAVGFYQKFTAWKMNYIYMAGSEVDRITSVYGFPNAVGLYVAPIVVFFLGLFFYLWRESFNKKIETTSRGRKIIILQLIFCLAVIFSGSLAVFLAHSDGAMVAIVGATGIMMLVQKKWRLAAVSLGLIALFALAVNPVWREIVVTKVTLRDWSGTVRIYTWKDSSRMLQDNWLFGAGLNNYPEKFAPYQRTAAVGIYQYPHNFILNFWSETGLVGLASIIGLVVWFLRLAILGFLRESGEKKYIYLGLLGVMIAILVHGLVDVPYFKNDLAVLWWVWFGVLLHLNSSS